MPEVYYLRHGRSRANEEDIVAGWLDSELIELGFDQARDRGEQVRASGIRFDRVLSSPLSRALDTVEIVSKAAGYEGEIEIIDDLKEKGSGSYQGGPTSVLLAATDGEVIRAGGETFDMFAERVRRVNRELSRRAIDSSGERWLIGGHSAVYRMADCLSKGWPPRDMLKTKKPANIALLRWPLPLGQGGLHHE